MSTESTEDAADEALWDEQFAKSQDILDQLAQEVHEEYLAGLTEDFDPDACLENAADQDGFE